MFNVVSIFCRASSQVHPCCSHVSSASNLHLFVVQLTAQVGTSQKERFPVLSEQYVWSWLICFSLRGGYLLIPSLSHPPGRISDLFGRGREGRSLFSWRELRREREIKSWTDIISWISTNLPQGCYIYYSVHRAIWVEGVWKFHADKGF